MAKRKKNKRDKRKTVPTATAIRLRETLFRIESTFEDGVPEVLRLVRPEQHVELSSDVRQNQFFTAYVPAHMLKPDESRRMPTDL